MLRVTTGACGIAGVAAAGPRLQDTGATVLDPCGLPRAVHDCAKTLAALSRRLFAFEALPYYLLLLESVLGAAHFDVPVGKARRLHVKLTARLPGYPVARLVREAPGRPGKTPLDFRWPTVQYDRES